MSILLRRIAEDKARVGLKGMFPKIRISSVFVRVCPSVHRAKIISNHSFKNSRIRAAVDPVRYKANEKA